MSTLSITVREPMLPGLLHAFEAKLGGAAPRFSVSTSSDPGLSSAVAIHAGPVSVWLRADEAEALGEALTRAVTHYRAATSEVQA